MELIQVKRALKETFNGKNKQPMKGEVFMIYKDTVDSWRSKDLDSLIGDLVAFEAVVINDNSAYAREFMDIGQINSLRKTQSIVADYLKSTQTK